MRRDNLTAMRGQRLRDQATTRAPFSGPHRLCQIGAQSPLLHQPQRPLYPLRAQRRAQMLAGRIHQATEVERRSAIVRTG